MTIEAVKAVGGLVVRPLGRDQQAVFGQDAEQAIPPDPQPGFRMVLQQEMQFPCAQPWLAHSHVPHELRNLPILLAAAIRRTVALVIGLATHAHELASPANAQPLDLPLREDLPGRFFTMETP
ncbi:hypothetical protein D3C84_892920 [compost metagenome]